MHNYIIGVQYYSLVRLQGTLLVLTIASIVLISLIRTIEIEMLAGAERNRVQLKQ